MPYDPQHHHRRSIRLTGYDYTQPGAYFVTLVTQDRACLFGDVVDGEMRLNEFGEIVRDEWFQTATIRPYVVLYPDEFVVMPNHIHGIIWIVDDDGMIDAGDFVGAQRRCAPTTTRRNDDTQRVGGATPTNVVPGSLGAIVRAFKSATTKRINEMRDARGAPVWQRNYYEHIIRNDHALDNIRAYIPSNPQHWTTDAENPSRQRIA